MFYKYTTDQLIALRSLCRDAVKHLITEEFPFAVQAKDVVQLMEYIDKELAARQRRTAA